MMDNSRRVVSNDNTAGLPVYNPLIATNPLSTAVSIKTDTQDETPPSDVETGYRSSRIVVSTCHPRTKDDYPRKIRE